MNQKTERTPIVMECGNCGYTKEYGWPDPLPDGAVKMVSNECPECSGHNFDAEHQWYDKDGKMLECGL